MNQTRSAWGPIIFLALAASTPAQNAINPLNPSNLPRVGTVSERFQSYNIEMVEVTGGRFWKPYGQIDAIRAKEPVSGNQPTGIDPALFQYRPPIDLASAKLRVLAAALSPAYVRVSGTWQNTTYFQNSDAPIPTSPPDGFNGVLTRAEWKGVVDFSNAVDAQIVTSVATSAGTRDANGQWTSAQAQQFFDYTKQAGGAIAATEYMNEPSFIQAGGVPKGYDGAAFGRDVAAFRAFLRRSAPATIFLGPGSVGEGVPLTNGAASGLGFMPSTQLLQGTGPAFDAFSYHYYGGVSSRCSGTLGIGTKEADALSPDWLNRTVQVETFYAGLRDEYVPGKPMWLTETGQTACGGDRWASTFVDTFRYLNQLGVLAKRGVQVVAHNTLAASDYALLDPKTLDPRPDYWAALLWRRLMGTTVLDAGSSPSSNLYVYAHCLRGTPSGVALLVLNTAASSSMMDMPAGAQRFTLTANTLDSKEVMLNGKPLALASGDTLPIMAGVKTAPGASVLPPHSITFVSVSGANNTSCRI